MAAKFSQDDGDVVVIIGSGAGGGTLANALAKQGIRVVVLEAGEQRVRRLDRRVLDHADQVLDSGPLRDALHKEATIFCLPHGAGGNGTDLIHLMRIRHFVEAHERIQRRLHGIGEFLRGTTSSLSSFPARGCTPRFQDTTSCSPS